MCFMLTIQQLFQRLPFQSFGLYNIRWTVSSFIDVITSLISTLQTAKN